MFHIAALPRSGTAYTAEFLRQCGLDVGHEQYGEDGIVSWLHVASGNVSWLPGPVEPKEHDITFHQVRNPLAVIASMATLRDESWEYMAKVIAPPKDATGLRRAMFFYLKWNELIESRKPVMRYKVEEMPGCACEMFATLGLDQPTIIVHDTPKDVNARTHGILLWEDLEAEDAELCTAIKAMATRYGYSVEDPPQIKLSAIMMVKNEQKYLAGCLGSLINVVDEIIIVDTGSTDDTVKIAQSFGARVFHHPWENNFSAHRNQSIGYATGDWLIAVDADEKLFDAHNLKKVLRTLPDEVGGVGCRFVDMQKGKQILEFNQLRIFRKGCVKYKNIVHNEPDIEGKLYFVQGPYYEHYGYDITPEEMEKKHARTITLLDKRLEQNPEDWKAHFYLMQSHGQRKDHVKAMYHGEKYIAAKEAEGKDFNKSVYFSVIQMAIFARDLDKAERYLGEALDLMPDDLDISQALIEYGAASGKTNLIAEGSRRFINNYETYKNNPVSHENRFVYSFNDEKLSFALYNVCMAGFCEGKAALERLKAILMKPTDNKHIARIDGMLEQNLGKMGIGYKIEGGANVQQ